MGDLAGRFLRRLINVILVLASLFSPALAQRFSFKYYGQEQGLNNLATECLFQDRTGYLWVGTQNGLFRYNGAGFTRFAEADGLPSASIEAITETPDGTLWVATQAGLAHRSQTRFTPFEFPEGIQSPGHFGLAADGSGRIYLSTMSGLLRSDVPAPGAVPKFEKIPGQTGDSAYGVHLSPGGSVWWGCGFSVCQLRNESIHVFGPAQGVPPARWDALLTDRDGTVWIRSSRYLLRKPHRSANFIQNSQPVPNIGDFAALTLGRDGELFVPTDDGVWELSNGRWRAIGQEQGLMSSSTNTVLQDREGSIWIGLWGAGIARWIGRNHWEAWTRVEGLSGEHDGYP